MPGGCADSTSEPTCSGTDSVTKQWSVSTGTDEPADSASDGEANTNNLISPDPANPAAQRCYDMVYKCYSDWYLPAKDQLNALYGQKATVGGFIANGYWSSTEDNTTNGWNQNFTNGAQNNDGKTNAYYVRCVRSY